MKNILVTGGCGYKGSVLVPKLLSAGHRVTVYDTQWFGNFLKPHPNLTVKKMCVLDMTPECLNNIDLIMHLSSVANDPCGDLNPKLTWELNALATMKLADMAVRHGIKQFIYASSGSVYGIKEEENVTEDLELLPITEYNKTKMIAERILLSYKDEMSIQIVRPATVCGLSPRMRLDVAVNMLTMQALSKNEITVLGGAQTRPNIHIEDITDVYMFLMDHPQHQGIFNAGFENISILDIAKAVTRHLPVSIKVLESNDPRSYRISSQKLLNLGYKPKKTVEGAIQEIISAFKAGTLKDEPHFYNLKWMQETVL